jgi:hypothetical protein
MTDNEKEKKRIAQFAEWILNISDGTTKSSKGEEWIKITSGQPNVI